MTRIRWVAHRTLRLSSNAMNLLTRLCEPGARIEFGAGPVGTGKLHLLIEGEDPHRVTSLQLDGLTRSGLVSRSPGTLPVYAISERGLEFVKNWTRTRCAIQGRDCSNCPLKNCLCK